jgi:hypothetical protein
MYIVYIYIYIIYVYIYIIYIYIYIYIRNSGARMSGGARIICALKARAHTTRLAEVHLGKKMEVIKAPPLKALLRLC